AAIGSMLDGECLPCFGMHGQPVLIAVAVAVDRGMDALAADERIVRRDCAVALDPQHFAIYVGQVLCRTVIRTGGRHPDLAVLCDMNPRAAGIAGVLALEDRLNLGNRAVGPFAAQDLEMARALQG